MCVQDEQQHHRSGPGRLHRGGPRSLPGGGRYRSVRPVSLRLQYRWSDRRTGTELPRTALVSEVHSSCAVQREGTQYYYISHGCTQL